MKIKNLMMLLTVFIIAGMMTSSLSAQKLDCSEENKIINKCNNVIKQMHEVCSKQLKKDRDTIIKQQQTIEKLDKKIGQDSLKHRAQGLGVGLGIGLILLIFL